MKRYIAGVIKSVWLCVGLLLLVPQTAMAQLLQAELPVAEANPEVPQHVRQTITNKIKAARSDLMMTNLRPSAVDGFYKIDLNGQVAFVSEDGSLLMPDIYQVTDNGLVSLQEEDRREQEVARRPQRAEILASIPKEDMVIYTPAKETKGHVYVFTDIDCGFCRKLHRDMDDMLEKGIEIRYLAFPRAGINSRSAQKLATVWCGKDSAEKQQLMTRFKSGKKVALNDCKNTPVANHYMLGRDIGIEATPTLVLATGELLTGARSADMLALEMGL